MICSQPGYSVSQLCASYSVSRQAYYQYQRRADKRYTEQQTVLHLVRQRRQQLQFEGGRKLLHHLQPSLQSQGIAMGRDQFFDLLRQHDLLIKRKRRRTVTTWSKHPFYVYQNLTKDLVLDGKHQLWVADITYLRTAHKFAYLALVTDAYSRKIVGYDVSDSLELTGCKRAVQMAIRQLPSTQKVVHHSDRGIQYCSHSYTGLLKHHNIKISMAEKGNCYENAMAERINGILKEEFVLDQTFMDIKHARKAVKQAVAAYNQIRLHTNLNFKTPNQIHKNPN